MTFPNDSFEFILLQDRELLPHTMSSEPWVSLTSSQARKVKSSYESGPSPLYKSECPEELVSLLAFVLIN